MSDEQVIYIGSDPQYCHIVDNAPGVSGIHCLVRYFPSRGLYEVEDYGSTNGTFVRGRQLVQGVPSPIEVGETIALGRGAQVVVRRDMFSQRPQGAAQQAQGVRAGASGSNGIAVTISIGSEEGNDIVIPSGIVSSRHARIQDLGGSYQLEDVGSLNGTWYHGNRVQKTAIQPGESFSLGSYPLVFNQVMIDKLVAKRSTVAAASRVKPIVVGRDDDCDVVVSERMISGRHCAITPLANGAGYLVEDLDSSNGVGLSRHDNKIKSAVVSQDDVLFLGSYRFPLAKLRYYQQRTRAGDKPIAGKVQIPQDQSSVSLGRDSELADIEIDQPQVSRRHAEVRIVQGRMQIRDLNSANGTFVNDKRISDWTIVKVGDIVALGSHRLGLDIAAGVVKREYKGHIAIQAEGLEVVVKNNETGKPLHLLSDVSFTVHPTEFVGLMGPSGAGKTTLLTALNGYTPPTNGRSLLNGKDLYKNYDDFRGNIGYVPQDDIVFPQLSVYESLYYTARLRLPPRTSDAEIDRKITEILATLEIQDTRNVLIGDALKKGISGGQRKRVNLAQELITEPALLFLDEPTSGLASEDTINVMRLLRKLADQGSTIILTIHQPSLDAYQQMDNIIYLFRGHQVYYGPAYPDSITFFNPEVTGSDAKEALLSDPGNALKPLAEDQRAVNRGEKDLRTVIGTRKGTYNASKYKKDFIDDRKDLSGAQIASGSKRKTLRRGMLRQFFILTSRLFKMTFKDKTNTGVLFAQAPIIAAVLAAVFAGVMDMDGAYFDTLVRGPAALFLLTVSSVWFGASNSARSIVAEQAVYKRERMVNLMIPSYALSKFAVLLAISAVQVTLLLGIVYVPLKLEGNFLVMLLGLFLASGVGVGMGLTISALVKSGEAAVALVPLTLIPQIVLGGVIMPIHQFGPAGELGSRLMATRWGYEVLMHEEYGDQDASDFQERCGIADCAWTGGNDASSGMYIAQQGDRWEDQRECAGFCEAVRRGDPVTPMDRSFGVVLNDAHEGGLLSAAVVDSDDTLTPREEAEEEVPEDAFMPDAEDMNEVRSSVQTDVGILAFFNLILAFLVMIILKVRDVAVG